MRRRRKSVRNVDDHRRGSIMARISRFYYFNAGPDRRGPRDSHTHSPILAWESFHSPPLYRFPSLCRRSRLYDRKLIVSRVPYGPLVKFVYSEISYNILHHP